MQDLFYLSDLLLIFDFQCASPYLIDNYWYIILKFLGMKKISLFDSTGWFLTISVVLYLIALCVGIASGWFSLVLLSVAFVLALVVVIEAVRAKRSIYTLLFRFGILFVCCSGIFENLGMKYLDAICTFLSFICVLVLLGRFIFYLNKYGVRDAEDHLDE